MHTRAVLCFWITLLAMTALAISSPDPEPIDPGLAAVVAQNLNLGCVRGCPGASSVQQLHTNAAFSPAIGPLSVLGGFILVGSVLAAI